MSNQGLNYDQTKNVGRLSMVSVIKTVEWCWRCHTQSSQTVKSDWKGQRQLCKCVQMNVCIVLYTITASTTAIFIYPILSFSLHFTSVYFGYRISGRLKIRNGQSKNTLTTCDFCPTSAAHYDFGSTLMTKNFTWIMFGELIIHFRLLPLNSLSSPMFCVWYCLIVFALCTIFITIWSSAHSMHNEMALENCGYSDRIFSLLSYSSSCFQQPQFYCYYRFFSFVLYVSEVPVRHLIVKLHEYGKIINKVKPLALHLLFTRMNFYESFHSMLTNVRWKRWMVGKEKVDADRSHRRNWRRKHFFSSTFSYTYK